MERVHRLSVFAKSRVCLQGDDVVLSLRWIGRSVSAGVVGAMLLALVTSLNLAAVATAAETDAEAAPGEAAHGGHDAEHHADPGHGNATASQEDPTEFRSDLAIYTLVVFLLLLAILGKFAWPVISEALEERERRIAGHIAAAEGKHEEAKVMLSQYEAKLEAATDEVRQLLEEARRDAEHTKAQIVAEAKAAAEAEHARALRDVEQATDAALKQIAERSASFVVGMTRQIVQEELSDQQQQRIVREALSKLSN